MFGVPRLADRSLLMSFNFYAGQSLLSEYRLGFGPIPIQRAELWTFQTTYREAG
jgi:hypothetical protein